MAFGGTFSLESSCLALCLLSVWRRRWPSGTHHILLPLYVLYRCIQPKHGLNTPKPQAKIGLSSYRLSCPSILNHGLWPSNRVTKLNIKAMDNLGTIKGLWAWNKQISILKQPNALWISDASGSSHPCCVMWRQGSLCYKHTNMCFVLHTCHDATKQQQTLSEHT